MLGKILEIKEITNVVVNNIIQSEGKQLGMVQLIDIFDGESKYDGFLIKTDKHEFNILIHNGQNCCESWGYFSSDDNFEDFIGKELLEFTLTDTLLNTEKPDDIYFSDDEVQFVNFKFSDGSLLQFAVYNSHNGFYGHSIIFAKDAEIFLQEVL